MDTTEVVIKTDTLIVSKDSSNRESRNYNSIETITLKESKSFSDYFCNCSILHDLIWPITILVIILLFRKKVKNLLDNVGDRVKKGHGFKVGPGGFEMSQELSNQEKNIKAENEFRSIEINQESSQHGNITREEFIPKYFQIERRLFEVLLKNLYPEYRVLSNRKIQGYEFDLIIENPRGRDYIAEVKYFPKNFSKISLRDVSSSLDIRAQVYKNTVQKAVKPILFLITNQETKVYGNIDEVFDYVNAPFTDKKYITVVVLLQSDIEQLNRLRIIDILEY